MHRRVPWKLTVRSGPKVTQSSFDDLDQALTVLEERARELSGTATNKPVEHQDRALRAGRSR